MIQIGDRIKVSSVKPGTLIRVNVASKHDPLYEYFLIFENLTYKYKIHADLTEVNKKKISGIAEIVATKITKKITRAYFKRLVSLYNTWSGLSTIDGLCKECIDNILNFKKGFPSNGKLGGCNHGKK